MVRLDTCPNIVSWSTSGYRKTGSTALMICFLKAPSTAVYFRNSAWFVGTSQFRALDLGRFPWLAGNHLGCSTAQTQNRSVPRIPSLWFSVWGAHAGLLQGLTTRTMHSNWKIDVVRLGIFLLVILQFLGGYDSGSPQGLPWRCLVAPSWHLSPLLGLTASLSHVKNRLICWRDKCS